METPESSRGATSQDVRTDGKRGALTWIKDAMLNESGTTEFRTIEEDDEEFDPDVTGSTANIKIAAYTGGARAENWAEAILSKLTPTQEQAYYMTKNGELNPTPVQQEGSRAGSEILFCNYRLVDSQACSPREGGEHDVQSPAGGQIRSRSGGRVIHNNSERIFAFMTNCKKGLGRNSEAVSGRSAPSKSCAQGTCMTWATRKPRLGTSRPLHSHNWIR